MYQLIAKDHEAKRGRLTTPHGVIETPVFMNVGTVAAIKGLFPQWILKEIKTQVELSNTYHLHVRPGDQVVKKVRRPPLVYELGSSDSYRFRRIPGVFVSRSEKDQRRGRVF